MIKHIVCYKLKDRSRESCEKARDLLLSMQGQIEQIKSIEVGVDILHTERSYDLVLQVLFESEAAMASYQQHDYHKSVVQPYMHSVRESSVSVDYKLL